MDSLYLALGLFFLYSFFGWLAEVAFSAVSRKKFVNTGFLTGPGLSHLWRGHPVYPAFPGTAAE